MVSSRTRRGCQVLGGTKRPHAHVKDGIQDGALELEATFLTQAAARKGQRPCTSTSTSTSTARARHRQRVRWSYIKRGPRHAALAIPHKHARSGSPQGISCLGRFLSRNVQHHADLVDKNMRRTRYLAGYRRHSSWMAFTTTTLNSSVISLMKVAICFIRRSTLLSLPVFSRVCTTQPQG